MTWIYSREKTLLRMAPWADIPLLREKVIEAVKEVFEQWGDHAPRGSRERFDQFLEGSHPTLPIVYELQVAFLSVFRRVTRQHSDDARWRDAKSEFDKYFFRQSFWVAK